MLDNIADNQCRQFNEILCKGTRSTLKAKYISSIMFC